MTPGFLNSNIVYCLAGLLCLAIWLRRRAAEKSRRLSLIGMLQGRNTWTEAIPPLLISAVFLFSLSRPFYGAERIMIAGGGHDIMVLLDVSNSMLAKDLKPTRLDFARRKLFDLVSLVQQSGTPSRLGLVLFAGNAQLFCPPTTDYAVLKTFIDAVSAEAITEGGSNITLALETAWNSLKASAALNPVIILVSDGEDNSEFASEMIANARSMRIRLNALGIGTPEGGPIEAAPGRYIRDRHGNAAISRLDEQTLSALARNTGGLYRRATLNDEDLKALLLQSKLRPGQQGIEEITSHLELGPWLLLAVLFLIAYYLALGKQALIFPLLLLLLDTRQAAFAEEKALDAHRAWRAFQAERYDEALTGFETQLKNNPDDLKILQALASAYYKTGEYAEAARLFARLAKKAKNGRQKFEALYNLGNARYMAAQPDTAVKSYEKALSIKPDDERVKANLAAARAALKATPPPPPQKPAEAEHTPQNRIEDKAAQKPQAPQDSPAQEEQHGAQDGNPEAGSPRAGGQSSSNGRREPDQGDSGKNEEGQMAQPAAQQTPGTEPAAPAPESREDGNDNDSQADQISKNGLNPERREDDGNASGTNAAGEREKMQESEGAQEDGAPEQPRAGNFGGLTSPDQRGFGVDRKREYDQKSLAREEAERWLAALPDSPALLYKRSTRATRQALDTW